MTANWYYLKQGQRHGPTSDRELLRLIEAGQLRPSDLVWRQGLPEWVRADSVEELFPELPSSDFSEGLHLFWEQVTLHVRRAFSWNLHAVTVYPPEAARLKAVGVTEATLRSYLVWRRSVLLVVIVPCFITAILHTINAADDFENLNAFGSLLEVVGILAFYALPVSASLAALCWWRYQRSHRILLAGGVVAFAVPILLALFPIEWVIDTQAADELERLILQGVGILLGIVYYIQLMPTVMSLLPGILRACLRLKTLIPAAVVPGWLLMGAAPLYFLLWLVVFVAVNQFAGNLLLILGILLWIGAPLVFLFRADLFIRPLTSEQDRQNMTRLQLGFLGAASLGALFLLIYLTTKELFGKTIVGFSEESSLVRPWNPDLLQFIVEYLTRSLFMTVLFADLILKMNLSIWFQGKQFAGSPEAAAYDRLMTHARETLGLEEQAVEPILLEEERGKS